MDIEHKPVNSIFRILEEKRKAGMVPDVEPRSLTHGRQAAMEEQTGLQEKFDRQRAARQAGFEYDKKTGNSENKMP
ncbi:MAG: hypothetical protein WCW52_00805 [Elusimicrobiales bacterium]|jgi:hypothetical protein